jgi:cobalt/nickel transport system permease protein
MFHDFLDRYSRGNSFWHRLPTGPKLATALLLMTITVLMPHRQWLWPGCLFVFLGLVTATCHAPLMFFLRRILFMEPVVLGISILALFQPHGIWIFLGLILKSTLCLWLMLLVSAVTPFQEVLHVLKKIHTPGLLITTLALMYRYLFVVVAEMECMHRARVSRTFVPQRLGGWPVMATMLGQLFIRTTERAERIYAAMCARGWK